MTTKIIKDSDFYHNIIAETLARTPVGTTPGYYSCPHTSKLNKCKEPTSIEEKNPDYFSYCFRKESGEIRTHMVCSSCNSFLRRQCDKLFMQQYK